MTEQNTPSQVGQPTRRKFLRRAIGGCLLGSAGALGYAYGVEPHWIDVVRRRLPIARLPQDLVGCRLVQISDIHIGDSVADDYMRQALGSLSQLKPDMIAITGDFMTSRRDEQVDHTLELMQYLPQTPLGRYAILGNHDYGKAGRHWRTASSLAAGLSDINVQVLRNEVRDVAGIQLAGLDELLFNRCLIQPTLDQLDPERPMLALCHNPDAVDQPGWENFRGWVLAGHTHGGQCKLPGFDPPITPVWNKRYTAGVFQLSGQRQMYINRGLGYFHRVRFNCRPEVTLFTLERAESA
ncbi:MAG: metallophosphoesterase [Planctomycetota bacterium]